MKDQDIEQLQAHIENRIRELQQLLDQSAEFAEKKSLQSDDEAANLDLTINASVDSTLLANLRTELALLSRNQQWLNSDEAGYCELCGDNIPLQRLLAAPHTRRCIDCAQIP